VCLWWYVLGFSKNFVSAVGAAPALVQGRLEAGLAGGCLGLLAGLLLGKAVVLGTLKGPLHQRHSGSVKGHKQTEDAEVIRSQYFLVGSKKLDGCGIAILQAR